MGRSQKKSFSEDEYRFGKGTRREKRKSKRKFVKDHLHDVKSEDDWWDYKQEMEYRDGDTDQ